MSYKKFPRVQLIELLRERDDENARLTQEVAKLRLDTMTGVLRRDVFEPIARREIEKALREGVPAFVFFFDLDFLKWVNDQVSTEAGDALIIALAKAVRSYDLVCRWEGDGFVILITGPKFTRRAAFKLIRRVREEFAQRLDELRKQYPAIRGSVAVGFTWTRQPRDLQDMVNTAFVRVKEDKARRGVARR